MFTNPMQNLFGAERGIVKSTEIASFVSIKRKIQHPKPLLHDVKTIERNNQLYFQLGSIGAALCCLYQSSDNK